ncbi:MAG: dienelactone hydrolase family protein [Patescibacteria group bacterium]|nr:dienelactone hydrolase family protein [Patescibacteria group bacterium]
MDEVTVKSMSIPAGGATLVGDLALPSGAAGLVIFVHGSGSSRLSPRNRYVADILQQAGFATLLFDLLTEKEDEIYENRFDIDLLTRRLMAATAWVRRLEETATLPIGYFGASTGAAAALIAAAELPDEVKTVVSRGGRPDLADAALERVASPTLLIVGGADEEVITLNESALVRLAGEKKMEIVPEATHLFEEPGALEEVARLAASWFRRHLR